jgi:hypothetical protein
VERRGPKNTKITHGVSEHSYSNHLSHRSRSRSLSLFESGHQVTVSSAHVAASARIALPIICFSSCSQIAIARPTMRAERHRTDSQPKKKQLDKQQQQQFIDHSVREEQIELTLARDVLNAVISRVIVRSCCAAIESAFWRRWRCVFSRELQKQKLRQLSHQTTKNKCLIESRGEANEQTTTTKIANTQCNAQIHTNKNKNTTNTQTKQPRTRSRRLSWPSALCFSARTASAVRCAST